MRSTARWRSWHNPKLRFVFAAIVFLLSQQGSVAFATPFDLNLIVNPNAELGAGAPNFGSTIAPVGWLTTSNFSAVQYAAGGAADLNVADSAAISGGTNYFAGGPDNALATASQNIAFADLAANVDAGLVTFLLSGFIGGFDTQGDNLRVDALFRNASSALLSVASIGPVSNTDRGNVSQLLFRSSGFTAVPTGARSVDILLTSTRLAGSYNDGYADNLSFQLHQEASGVVPEPTSFVLLGTGVLAAFAARRRGLKKREIA